MWRSEIIRKPRMAVGLHLQGADSGLASRRASKPLDHHIRHVASSSSLHLPFSFYLFWQSLLCPSLALNMLVEGDLAPLILQSPPPTFWGCRCALPCTGNVPLGLNPGAWCILGWYFPAWVTSRVRARHCLFVLFSSELSGSESPLPAWLSACINFSLCICILGTFMSTAVSLCGQMLVMLRCLIRDYYEAKY